jgi:hypothetical protein
LPRWCVASAGSGASGPPAPVSAEGVPGRASRRDARAVHAPARPAVHGVGDRAVPDHDVVGCPLTPISEQSFRLL